MEQESYRLQTSNLSKFVATIEMLNEAIAANGERIARDFKGVEAKEKLVTAELYALQAACNDLDRMYASVDMALMRYHRMKIQEINGIIKVSRTHSCLFLCAVCRHAGAQAHTEVLNMRYRC